MMKKSGYVPQPAFSGTEAILYVEKKKWDMVLLDLMLPGMDGEEVLRKIREHHHFPVLIISAKGEQQTKINGLRAGADDFITKPFDIEEVMARIDAHIFDRFYTGDTARNKKGTGLGLSIAQSLMKKMNGELFATLKNHQFIMTCQWNKRT
ncbi:DNA-binding response OmpR family regulator [Peribacillus frigoritolerans]|uniref:ATP-binding response regulator n=1 Tax=Peribacillus frigoritolerans TaxID=450367 RepID=UPI00383868AE